MSPGLLCSLAAGASIAAMYDDDQQYEYAAPPKSPVPAAIVTSILTTALLFIGLRLLESRGYLAWLSSRPSATEAVEVPSLLGMRPDQAGEILKGRALLLTIASEREDAQYPAGAIAAQTPLSGSQAPRGSAVQAVISRGLRQVQVPNVVGLTAEEAQRQIAAAGLAAGPPKTAPSATAAAGTVVETAPAPGAPLAPGGAVTLVVSSGAPGKPVPKVLGLRLSRARKLLTDEGFVVGKVRIVSDGERTSGVVLEQQPAAGVTAAVGTAVDLFVNDE